MEVFGREAALEEARSADFATGVDSIVIAAGCLSILEIDCGFVA
jgi:hypothetical protein